MLAAVLHGRRDLRMEERPRPPLARGEALVRVRAVGLCGSDLHYYQEGRIGNSRLEAPLIPGHEAAGEVIALGEGVADLRVGERVALEPAIPCRSCRECRSGKTNICKKVRFLGSYPVDGACCELLSMPAANLLPVEVPLSFEELALLEPLAVALHALGLVGFRAGETAAVVGAGTIGLLTLAAARAAGADAVYATDKRASSRKLAERWGARAAPAPEDAARSIPEAAVVFEAAGTAEAFNLAFELAGPGGRVALIGIDPAEATVLSLHVARRKELVLCNVRRSCDELAQALELAKSAALPLAELLTHRFALRQAREAFEYASPRPEGLVKAVLTI